MDDFACAKTMARGLGDNTEVFTNLGSNTMWLVAIITGNLEGD